MPIAPESERFFATTILADYASDQPSMLADLLMDVDEKQFAVIYPEDYDRASLAGKTVKFRAVVKAVRRKEPPELNDEFAKDLGDFKTLEELKETIRKSIRAVCGRCHFHCKKAEE